MSEFLTCSQALVNNVAARPIGQVEGVFRGGDNTVTQNAATIDAGSSAVLVLATALFSTPGAVTHGLVTSVADLVTAPFTNVCRDFTEMTNSHYRPYAAAHEPVNYSELKNYASSGAERIVRNDVLGWNN